MLQSSPSDSLSTCGVEFPDPLTRLSNARWCAQTVEFGSVMSVSNQKKPKERDRPVNRSVGSTDARMSCATRDYNHDRIQYWITALKKQSEFVLAPSPDSSGSLKQPHGFLVA